MEIEHSPKQREIPIQCTSLNHMRHPGSCPEKISYAKYHGYKIRVTEYDISFRAVITTPLGEEYYISQAFYYTLKRFAFQILKNRIRKFILEDMSDN